MQRVTVDSMEREQKVKFLRVRGWGCGGRAARGRRLAARGCCGRAKASFAPTAPPAAPAPLPPPQALASRIQAKRLSLGQVQRILHARVPILKFRDVSGERPRGQVGGQAGVKAAETGRVAGRQRLQPVVLLPGGHAAVMRCPGPMLL